jgi:hypothetical protein
MTAFKRQSDVQGDGPRADASWPRFERRFAESFVVAARLLPRQRL